MPADTECWKNMQVPVRRFLWDINPWNFVRPWVKNPWYRNEDFPEKKRSAMADLLPGHAVTNLFVEFCRRCPYRAGHWWVYENIFVVFIMIASGIGYFFIIK